MLRINQSHGCDYDLPSVSLLVSVNTTIIAPIRFTLLVLYYKRSKLKLRVFYQVMLLLW